MELDEDEGGVRDAGGGGNYLWCAPGMCPGVAGIATASSNSGLAEGSNGGLVAGECSGGSLTHGRRLRIALEG